jgi:very-short-patch-repair endonuclease
MAARGKLALAGKRPLREIPWAKVVAFHGEISRRSEEEFFSLPIRQTPSDRWSHLQGFEPDSLAGPWVVPVEAIASPSLLRAIESGNTPDLFLAGPCWLRWEMRDQGQWVATRTNPAIFREVTADWQDDGTVLLRPAQGNWELSPLVAALHERKNVVMRGPADELLPNVLEQAQAAFDEHDLPLADALADALAVLSPELGDELRKARTNRNGGDSGLPVNWVLFSAPSQASAIHQHIRRDYELLAGRLAGKDASSGGLRLLAGGHAAGKAAPSDTVLPIVPLNDSQFAAVQGVLGSRPVTVISGPPGCGKSQVVLSVMLNAWAAGKSVLFASNNNQAVDVIRQRLERFEDDFPIAVRAGARKYSLVEESIRRTLNAATGLSGQEDSTESGLPARRAKLLERKAQVNSLLESQLPQQVHEASTAAISAYHKYHKRRDEQRTARDALTGELGKLGYSVRPEQFAQGVLDPLVSWLDGATEIQHQLDQDAADRLSLERQIKASAEQRNRSMQSVGCDATGASPVGWLKSGPGPELLEDWKATAEELLREPIEERLEQSPWDPSHERWRDAASAREWASGVETLTGEIREAAAALLPILRKIGAAQAALETESRELHRFIGHKEPIVSGADLAEWMGLYAEYCALPAGRFDNLPLSRRDRIRRRLARIETRFRSGLPLAVWRDLGVMSDVSRGRLAEILERVSGWIDARDAWAGLEGQREQLEDQLAQFRARAGKYDLKGIPSGLDLGAWDEFAEATQAHVPIALRAASAWEALERRNSALDGLRKLASRFRTVASGVPIKEAWCAGQGARFLSVLQAVEHGATPEAVKNLRTALYDDALSRLLQSWHDAREREAELSELRRRLDEIPSMESRMRPWITAAPAIPKSVPLVADALPDDGHPIKMHLAECLDWQRRWSAYVADITGPGRRQLEEDKQFALARLADAVSLAPTEYREPIEEVTGPILEKKSPEWPVDEIARAFMFFVPEQLKAELQRLDGELERLSFEQAKQEWIRRLSENAEVQDSLEQLLAHYRRYGNKIEPEAYGHFRRALEVMPIWVTAAMSAQSIPMEPELFDLLVIDEATQCTLTNMLPLIYRAKRLVVIGDPEQLPAIYELGSETENALAARFGIEEFLDVVGYVNNDMYTAAVKTLPRRRNDVLPLLEHYRSHPLIIGFSNKNIYRMGLKLRKASGQSRVLRSGNGVFGHRVSGQAGRGPRNSSWINVPEAQAVAEMVAGLRADGTRMSIGVVTPFKAQKEVIEEQLRKHDLLRNVVVDTVHRFQGDERDVMIFSPVVARGITDNAARWVEKPHNLINVAVTRARDAFFLVADFDSCRQQEGILGQLTAYVETVELLRKTSEAELQLFTELVTHGFSPEAHERIGDIEVDFVLEREGKRLVVEVDGSQHEQTPATDRGRDAFLISQGYDVLRVSARDVLETPALVLRQISDRLAGVVAPGPMPAADAGISKPVPAGEPKPTANSNSEFDPDLFPQAWIPAIESVTARGWRVAPGEDLVENERVIGGSVVICSKSGRTVYGVDDADAQPKIRKWARNNGKEIAETPEVLMTVCD